MSCHILFDRTVKTEKNNILVHQNMFVFDEDMNISASYRI